MRHVTEIHNMQLYIISTINICYVINTPYGLGLGGKASALVLVSKVRCRS